jgi:hypothetical protein
MRQQTSGACLNLGLAAKKGDWSGLGIPGNEDRRPPVKIPVTILPRLYPVIARF